MSNSHNFHMGNYCTNISPPTITIAIDKIVFDSSIVHNVLNGLLDSYQSFASTFCLITKGNPNAISFAELISIVL